MPDYEASGTHSPSGRLTLYILIAIVLAVVVALAIPHVAMQFKVGGEIFLRILMMMVVPLVMASVMSGIIGLGDVRKLGKPGIAAVTYYGTTTVLAVLLGLVAVNVIAPGVGTVDPEYLESFTGEEIAHLEESKPESMGDILENLLLMLFTRNLILSAAEASLLPLIFFSIVFASMLTTMGSRIRAITEMIVQVNDALLELRLAADEPCALRYLLPRDRALRRGPRRGPILGGAQPDGLVLCDGTSRTGDPRIRDTTVYLLGVHEKKSVPIHGSNVPGASHRFFDRELLGDASHHDENSHQ